MSDTKIIHTKAKSDDGAGTRSSPISEQEITISAIKNSRSGRALQEAPLKDPLRLDLLRSLIPLARVDGALALSTPPIERPRKLGMTTLGMIEPFGGALNVATAVVPTALFTMGDEGCRPMFWGSRPAANDDVREMQQTSLWTRDGNLTLFPPLETPALGDDWDAAQAAPAADDDETPITAPNAAKEPEPQAEAHDEDRTATVDENSSIEEPAKSRSAPKAESWTPAMSTVWTSAAPVGAEIVEFYARQLHLPLPSSAFRQTRRIIRAKGAITDLKEGKIALVAPVRDLETHAGIGLHFMIFQMGKFADGAPYVTDFIHPRFEQERHTAGPRHGYIKLHPGGPANRTLLVAWGDRNAQALRQLGFGGDNPAVVALLGYPGSAELDVAG